MSCLQQRKPRKEWMLRIGRIKFRSTREKSHCSSRVARTLRCNSSGIEQSSTWRAQFDRARIRSRGCDAHRLLPRRICRCKSRSNLRTTEQFKHIAILWCDFRQSHSDPQCFIKARRTQRSFDSIHRSSHCGGVVGIDRGGAI